MGECGLMVQWLVAWWAGRRVSTALDIRPVEADYRQYKKLKARIDRYHIHHGQPQGLS